MNASKTLIAAVAAATIVGTVGFVSAQTTDSSTPNAAQSGSMTAPAGTMAAPAAPSGNMAAPSTTDSAAPAQGSSTSEPAPKADRN
jgi:hypothetical protein